MARRGGGGWGSKFLEAPGFLFFWGGGEWGVLDSEDSSKLGNRGCGLFPSTVYSERFLNLVARGH
jgi:hypothetical protein